MPGGPGGIGLQGAPVSFSFAYDNIEKFTFFCDLCLIRTNDKYVVVREIQRLDCNLLSRYYTF